MRCTAFISKNNLLHNIALIRKMSGQKKIVFMVKANAYGHGLELICDLLKKDEDIVFGVAALNEALLIRSLGLKQEIFLFDGGAFLEQSHLLFEAKLSPVLASTTALAELIKESSKHLQKIDIHLKIDTGFCRNGLDYKELLAGRLDKDLLALKNSSLNLVGVATHLSMADVPESDFSQVQLKRFEESLVYVENLGLKFSQIHFANSASILRGLGLAKKFERYQFLPRPGLLAYGLSPLEGEVEAKPVMSIKAPILNIKELKAQEGVGYGQSFIANEPTKIGVVPMGYGDGLRRILSNKAHFLLNGQKVPVVGTISMDSCTVSLNNSDVQIGTLVTILGEEKNLSISAQDWALLCQSISYEMLTSISLRVSRQVI